MNITYRSEIIQFYNKIHVINLIPVGCESSKCYVTLKK